MLLIERGAVSLDVVTEIVVERAVDAVSAFASNPDNAPRWYVNIKSVEWESSPPLRVGSRIAFVAQFLGRRLAYTYEVVAFEASVRLVMRTTQGPFPMETTYEWSGKGPARTAMTLRNRGAPRGIATLIRPLIARAMRRANRADLLRLKTILESEVHSFASSGDRGMI